MFRGKLLRVSALLSVIKEAVMKLAPDFASKILFILTILSAITPIEVSWIVPTESPVKFSDSRGSIAVGK